MTFRYAKRLYRLAATGLFLLVSAVTGRADIISEWTEQALAGARSQNELAPEVSRNLAMMHAAMYNAVEGIAGDRNLYTHGSYSGPSSTAVFDSSREAAAASAAFTVLQDLYPSMAGSFATLYSNQLTAIGDTTARTNGVSYGTVVGQDILNWRANDGRADANNPPYSPVGSVPYWSPTGPAYASAALPGWGNVDTFAIASTAGYTGSLGSSLSTYVASAEYAADFNQVKDLGSATSSTRTSGQLNAAHFWYGAAGTGTNVAVWNSLAADIVTTQSLNIQDSARLYASLNLAMADASIATYQIKYDVGLWSPETAIQNGAADGNPLTTADSNWTPLLASPNSPSYISEQAALGGAAITILDQFMGSTTSFTIGSDTNGDGTNDLFITYSSLAAAFQDAAGSGIWAGSYFQRAATDGGTIGTEIGNVVLNTQFAPVPEPSGALMIGVTMTCWLLRRRRVIRL